MRKRGIAVLLALVVLLSGCGKQETQEESGGTDLRVYCFAAGSADAFLLTTENAAVLVDTGEKGFGKEIVRTLEARGIDAIDVLIVTHFDKDHVGGAAKVLQSVPVGTVLQSNCPKDSSEYENYLEALDAAGIQPVTVRSTYRFTLDGVAYTVDPPRKADYTEDDSNNSSLALSVENGADRLLFLGDAETERLQELLAAGLGTYDFLKIPHHGRWQSLLPELVEAVSPSCAVITSSEKEPEDQETLDLLAEHQVDTFLTRSASVIVSSTGAGVSADYESS
jgi:beta-lactamase superfamily II metal-dependent hydrolase